MDAGLQKAHEGRIAALLSGDLEALDNYVDDDLTYTSPHGRLMTKSEVFDSFRSGVMKVETMEISDLLSRQYGDTAILTYRAHTVIHDHGAVTSGNVRSTAVYLRRNENWKLVAQQQTAIAEKLL